MKTKEMLYALWKKNQTDLITDTVSFGESTWSAGGAGSLSESVAKTGYTPLGIVGINKGGAGNGTVIVSNYQINGTTATLGVYNPSGTSRTITITLVVLYKKI